jgi:hypothetical protein
VPEEESRYEQYLDDDVTSQIEHEANNRRPLSLRAGSNINRITITPGLSKSPSSRMSLTLADRRYAASESESLLRAIEIQRALKNAKRRMLIGEESKA